MIREGTAALDRADDRASPPNAWRGAVAYLHLCPRAFLPMRGVETMTLVAGRDIEGDRYASGSGCYSYKPEEGR